MIAVKSSNLQAVDFDDWSGTLVILFRSGDLYEYYRVPAAKYSGLMRASSHGKYFHTEIRNIYPYRKVT